MNDAVEIGLTSSATYTVTEDMSPPHLSNKVLSTPHLIQFIEQTCLLAVQEHLDDNQTTVGIHVCVSHSASVDAGQDVEVNCEITEIDRKRLVFDTRVTSADATVSEGTHQRFVVGG
ncbi:MAG: thioesterase family protein [Actinomycetia bacterium]|nr:thioesterase family protein [Actinomycetes bacterium]MCP4225501.1 thioesterase family protein [Actinomycetes bacterium]